MDCTTAMSAPDTINICLVEDDLGDAKAIRRAFGKKGNSNTIMHAKDGLEALELLREAGSTIPPRFLVILDLNMPRMNGKDFLREIRNDQNLSQAVVFVLTTSDDYKDISDSFDQNVAGYFVKAGHSSYENVVNVLTRYWETGAVPFIPRKAAG